MGGLSPAYFSVSTCGAGSTNEAIRAIKNTPPPIVAAA
jgi:hypothetical protein